MRGLRPKPRLAPHNRNSARDDGLMHRESDPSVRKSGRELMTTRYAAYAAAPRRVHRAARARLQQVGT
jgi:hypothetical protein